MCSYQRINKTYGCHNQKAQNGLLKTELGFEGFVVSDWGAQHVGIASAEGGLDMAMPNGGFFWGEDGSNLTAIVQNDSIPEARLTDMATRMSQLGINSVKTHPLRTSDSAPYSAILDLAGVAHPRAQFGDRGRGGPPARKLWVPQVTSEDYKTSTVHGKDVYAHSRLGAVRAASD